MRRRTFVSSLLAFLTAIIGRRVDAVPEPEAAPDKWLCIEAALAIRAKLPDIGTHYDQATLIAADRYRGISLRGAFTIISRDVSGYDWVAKGDAGLVEGAFLASPHWKDARRDAGDLLRGLASKFLVAGFRQVDDSWRKIASIRSISDFQMRLSHSLSDEGQYVMNGIALYSPTDGETAYALIGDRYAKMFSIGIDSIYADDLEAIAHISKMIGRGGALKFHEVFWELSRANEGKRIEVGFLNGQEMPVIENVTLDRDSMRIGFAGYYDFGCAVGDPIVS